MRHLLTIVFACVAVALSPKAQAQNGPVWPTRPIRLIVPTGAGAATDIMARLLANGIGSGPGQPVVVENMPGASGLLAHQAVARAQPDGYTLLFTNTSGMGINPVSFKILPYDPVRDFTAIAMVCSLGPQMLSVNAELPVKTVPEFFDYARAHRGKLAWWPGLRSRPYRRLLRSRRASRRSLKVASLVGARACVPSWKRAGFRFR